MKNRDLAVTLIEGLNKVFSEFDLKVGDHILFTSAGDRDVKGVIYDFTSDTPRGIFVKRDNEYGKKEVILANQIIGVYSKDEPADETVTTGTSGSATSQTLGQYTGEW